MISTLRRARRLMTGGWFAVVAGVAVPLTVFYATLPAGTGWAITASLLWAAVAFGWERARRRPFSPLLASTTITLIAKTAAWTVGHSSTWFFASPIVEEALIGFCFALTWRSRTPLLLRVLRDVSPRVGAVLSEACHRRLVAAMSLAWAGSYLASAASAAALLAALPASQFVVAREFTGLFWDGAGLAVSLWAGRGRIRQVLSAASSPTSEPVEAGRHLVSASPG